MFNLPAVNWSAARKNPISGLGTLKISWVEVAACYLQNRWLYKSLSAFSSGQCASKELYNLRKIAAGNISNYALVWNF